MPRIDAVDLMRRIAAIAPPSHVLVLTAFPQQGRIRAAMAPSFVVTGPGSAPEP